MNGIRSSVGQRLIFLWRNALQRFCADGALWAVFFAFGAHGANSTLAEKLQLRTGAERLLLYGQEASRYNVNECFLTFPFPRPTPEQEAAIAAAAKELNELRERWLNPPEWTVERVLEFPGSVNGPWSR